MRMKMTIPFVKALTAATFCSAFLTIAHGQNIVGDPGFEATGTGPFPAPWVLQPDGTDPDQYSEVVHDTNPGAPFAHSGTNYAALGAADLQNNAVPSHLKQTLATTAGSFYNISFFLAQDTIDPVTFNQNYFQAYFGGLLLFTAPLIVTPNTDGRYIGYSFVAQALTNSTLLDFSFSDNDDRWRLDDVSVSATPETGASLTLLAAAFMTLLATKFFVNRANRGTRS